MSIKKQKSERLQKILASCGYGSRREIENFIQSRRISINGQLATLGDRIEIKPNTKIRLDGHLLKIKDTEKTVCRVLAYYKLEGEICTNHDLEGRPTIFDRLPKLTNSRWVSIGRLDINTYGLLLFTTSGELANRLMHPRYKVEREYVVRVFGEVNYDKIRKLKKGIWLEDGEANFKSLTFRGGNSMNKWFNVTLTEGRNREVRRLWEAVGIKVSRLIRIRYGEIYLPKWLPRGGWTELGSVQINYLRQLVGLTNEIYSNLSTGPAKCKIKVNQIRHAIKQHTQS